MLVDAQLSKKLAEELNHETKESLEKSFIQDFQSQGLFRIEDEPGKREIRLKRTFGNEDITVTFDTDTIYEQEEEDSVDVTVTIAKPQGVVEFLVTLGESTLVDSVVYMKNANEDPEEVYPGPRMTEVDDDLHDDFVEYLEERQIDDRLAQFVAQYAEYKEEMEYRQWLKNVKAFVDQ